MLIVQLVLGYWSYIWLTLILYLGQEVIKYAKNVHVIDSLDWEHNFFFFYRRDSKMSCLKGYRSFRFRFGRIDRQLVSIGNISDTEFMKSMSWCILNQLETFTYGFLSITFSIFTNSFLFISMAYLGESRLIISLEVILIFIKH